MNTILFSIIVVCIIVLTFYLVQVLIELKYSIISFRKTTEEKINPVFDEIQYTLKNTKNITSNINEIIIDVRTLSHSVNEIGKTMNVINEVIKEVNSEIKIKILSLKAGIITALKILVNNFNKKETENV